MASAIAVAGAGYASAQPLLPSSVEPAMCMMRFAVEPAAEGVWLDSDLVVGARAAWSEGRLDDARAMLDEATRRFPRIADHIAVMLGEIELEAGDPAAARTRFESVATSSNPSIRLEGRIGTVRALIELGARDARAQVDALLAEFPELPDAERLEYAQALAIERSGRHADAVRAFRELDLHYPGSVYAQEARAHLAALLTTGTAVTPYSAHERVERATRLTASGPVPAAKATVELLLADDSLDESDRRTVLRLAIRIARVEGRFSDVTTLERRMRERMPRPVTDEELDETDETLVDEPAVAVDTNERGRRARAAMERILHGRGIARAPIENLGEIADIAAGGGLDDSLRVIADRARDSDVPAEVRFAVAVAVAGRPGLEDLALSMLSGFGGASGDLATGARYHRARLLERLGRYNDARELFEGVLAADRSSGQYYSMWCVQRLPVVDAEIAAHAEDVVSGASPAALADGGVADSRVLDSGVNASTPVSSRGGRTFDLDAIARATGSSLDLDRLASELDAVAAPLDASYPWIGRAADLLRVRAIEESRSELFEALVGHRLSGGRGVHRYGLEAVSRGVSRATRPTRAGTGNRARPTGNRAPARVSRRPLDDATRDVLADVAAALGDHGTAIAFGGTHSADDRPHAFATEVAAAARQYDVDPNLLWAVMRVESVYQPRIVSYAGAIGLMQIMPRTGRLIAERLGRDRFTTAQLLDPQTNLDFAAWYLHSLIERFDGHVPLAIAAYNGGPHNVRVWLERSGPELPLDAFLERIPFDQTHRYVRRVLTHYAAYRARDGLPMVDLGVGVPPARPDDIAF